MTPEEMVSRVLYRDGLMLVIDKPAGFAVHRGPKGGESLEDYFDALRFGLPRAPALAHRLDRDTSGCLVLGRHRKALAQLGSLFKNGAIEKRYWAVVDGSPDAEEGVIELALGRRDAARGWWMRHDPDGQPALTKWKVMGRGNSPARRKVGRPGVTDAAAHHLVTPRPTRAQQAFTRAHASAAQEEAAIFCWLALEPATGRTHQLRVHCAEMGWPIVGDAIYGTAPRSGGLPLHLHAREIAVRLYKNREAIHVVAPVPDHMRERLIACGWRGEEYEASLAVIPGPERGERARNS
ncbi:MAG: RluA family pseudouridine synthase [Pseudomonadota bacterium]